MTPNVLESPPWFERSEKLEGRQKWLDLES